MAGIRIALAKGDGIGPEIMDAALELFAGAGVMDAAAGGLEFIPVEMGAAVFAQGNSRGMSAEAVRVTEECGILFKGPMETPKGGGGKSINVTARKMWSAYANFRTFKTLPGVETVYSRAGIFIDMAIVRENIEDTYGGIERRVSADVVECKRLISAPGSDQVHRFAFEAARRLGVKRLYCGHKANIMKLTDGLFLERFKAMAKAYPEIEAGDVIVDALCMNLVVRPQQYQMIVLPNLQGDIVSDLCAGLVGGLGFAPSANIGAHISIFEAVHGTAPDIAGKGIANPTSLILSGLMMLRHLGLEREAAVVENALLATLEAGVRTGDFGDRSKPALGTRAFVAAIKDRLGSTPRSVPAVAVPAQNPARYARPARPAAMQLMQTFRSVESVVVGCDIYIHTTLPIAELVAALQPFTEGTALRLTMISIRGTQVWPTGSLFTECVDYARVRFETEAGGAVDQQAVTAFAAKLEAGFAVSSIELLRMYDGVRGYSLAQGQ